MNLETFHLYCDIVRLHSFSRGARANNVTQSAASQAIAQLEQQLGLRLIDRSKRPFAVTPQGQRYYEGVKTLLSDYSKLEAEVKRASSQVAGAIRVAAIYSVGLYDLGGHMRRFMSEYPQVQVRLEYLRPNKVYDAVVNEEADIGIMSYPKNDRTVEVLPWRSEKMVFVCHPSHRLAARPLIFAPDISGENFIAFDSDLPIRKAIDRSLKQHHSHVNVVMEFDNIETMKQAVEINAGVSILPEPTVRRSADGKRMIAIPLAMPELVRPVGIIHRKQNPLTPTVQRFIQLLQKADESVAPIVPGKTPSGATANAVT
ncbi:MAG TPA: LysR family transcriptional regulator [Planctomycetota bacterium]|nr:LysR family transcriptional regulator [Planctomycetota bacterium]